jgi:hypothetical protein
MSMVVVKLLRDFLLRRMDSQLDEISAGIGMLIPGRIVCLFISNFGLTTQEKLFT